MVLQLRPLHMYTHIVLWDRPKKQNAFTVIIAVVSVCSQFESWIVRFWQMIYHLILSLWQFRLSLKNLVLKMILVKERIANGSWAIASERRLISSPKNTLSRPLNRNISYIHMRIILSLICVRALHLCACSRIICVFLIPLYTTRPRNKKGPCRTKLDYFAELEFPSR